MHVDPKKISFAGAIFLVFCLPFFAFALPEGESVVAGSAAFDRSTANTLNINTPSDRLIVNYNSFSVAQPETVNFQQPSASSIVLNRVVGVDPSSIMGTLNANGRVFIVNPNGVLFGPNSHVDVAGLVASSLNISNDDFLNGNYVFTKSGKNGYVINQGTINALSGGYVCLLGGAVDNSLAIQADLGTVVLAAGEKITLSLEDQNAISVVVDEAVQSEVFGPDGAKMTSAVKNSGTILAEGGKVMLTAKVLNKVFDHAINNTGLVKVSSLVKHDGIIELMAEGADVVNTKTGQIIADAVAAASPDGGKISIQAASVLQQGLVSANAIEQGTAGEVIIVSEGTTTLDESSSTEARAMGIVGNGGKISIKSKNGSVFVKKNAKIDFSAGTVAGNGGLFKVDAFQQLGFFGILNGRAPPGYTPGKAILDPLLSDISGEFAANTVIYSPNNITLAGDVSFSSSLTLLAGHNSETPGDWTYVNGGAILNPDGYLITSLDDVSSLTLWANAGIGTSAQPLRINVDYLEVEVSGGSSYIAQGTKTLNVTLNSSSESLVEIRAAGRIAGSQGYESGTIRAYDLYLEAVGGIGTYTQPLRIDVDGLSAAVTGGDIYIEHDSERDLYISSISAVGNSVWIRSSNGIYNGGDNTNITAETLYIEANDGIGYEYVGEGGEEIYPLEVSVDNLIVLNSGESGGIYISNDKDLVILSAVNWASNAPIQISATGNITIGEGGISSDWGDISLTATGAILRSSGLLASWDFGDGYECGTEPIPSDNFGFGSGSFTIIVWYQGTQAEAYRGLVGAVPFPGTDSVQGYALQNHYGSLRYWLNGQEFISDIPINTGSLLQLTMVRDGTTGRMYISNGEDIQYSSADFSVGSGSVNSDSLFWIGGWGMAQSAETGESRLVEGTISGVRVYNRALSGFEINNQSLLSGTGEIYGGDVTLSAVNGIDVVLGGIGEGPQDVTASNTGSGSILISSQDSFRVSDSGISNNGGDVDLSSPLNITVNGPITASGTGDVTIEAAGNLTVSNNIQGHDIYLRADYDEFGYSDGLGSLTMAYEIRLTADSYTFQGANDFTVSIAADGPLYTTLFPDIRVLMYTPESTLDFSGLDITSTGDYSITVSGSNSVGYFDSIKLDSGGDLSVATPLSAESIELSSDGDIYINADLLANSTITANAGTGINIYNNLAAMLISLTAGADISSDSVPITLTAMNHYLQASGDFTIAGDSVEYNSGLFRASLVRGDYDSLQSLDVRSTGGTVTISEAFARGDSGIVSLYGYNGVNINAPINLGQAGLNIVSYGGGAITGISELEGYHIYSAGYVFLNGATIGSLETPVKINITGNGYLDLIAYGSTEQEGEQVSGVLEGITPTNTITVLYPAPGAVYFNEIPVVYSETPVVPPSDVMQQEGIVLLIMSYEPNTVGPEELTNSQFSTPAGTLFGYHPLTSTDMEAIEQLRLNAGSYSLSGGVLSLVGNEGLLQFFQEFDQKRKSGSL